jgi:hypothetical protein
MTKGKPSETEIVAMLLACTGNPEFCDVQLRNEWNSDNTKNDRVFWRRQARELLRALRSGR